MKPTHKHQLYDEDDSTTSDQSLFPPDPDKLGWVPRLTMFDLWSDDEAIVFEAIRELADIADTDEQSYCDRQLIHEAGGHFSIISAMNKWYDNREVTVDGLRALANLGANTPFRDASVAFGGMEVTLLAMINYPECCYVQRNACAAICRLCLDSKPNAAHFVGELGGLPLLFGAMQSFPDHIKLQKWALLTLYDFTAIEQLRLPIVKCGGVKALTRFMTKFQGEPPVSLSCSLSRCFVVLARFFSLHL